MNAIGRLDEASREFQMTSDPRSARAGSADRGTAVPSVDRAGNGVFRREGEFWTIAYRGKPFRLKDSKGLGYIAHLLRHPGVEFHVLDLVGGIATDREQDETYQRERGLPRSNQDLEKAGLHVTGLGDAGE